jgi:uncharacterized membrane protein
MDFKGVLKWVYVIGVLVASLAGAFSFHNDILMWVLMVVGVVLGLFYFDSSDLMNFGIRYLALGVAASALDKFVAVGPYITGFFQGFFGFVGPVVLAMIVMFFIKKYFGGMQPASKR